MSKGSSITFADWMKLLVFYVLTTFARGIMVGTFIPCLRRLIIKIIYFLDQDMDYKQKNFTF